MSIVLRLVSQSQPAFAIRNIIVKSLEDNSRAFRMSASANIPVLLRIVSETTSIVNVAGAIVRKVLQSGNMAVIDKGINDLQTKADRAVQHYIVSRLGSQFPRAVIIGEEPEDPGSDESFDELISSCAGQVDVPFPDILKCSVPASISSISEEQVVVWIDPLDGTAEFLHGLVGHVTVLVGIAVNGIPVGGVIHQPFYGTEGNQGRTIWGIPGVGLGGIDITKPPANTRIIATTRAHSTPRVEATLAALEPTEILRVGGAGHKVLLLLEGKAHAFVFNSAGTKKWDTCAPEAILRTTGGILTGMTGKPYNYSKVVQHLNAEGILATAAGEDHEWYVSRCRIPSDNNQ